MYQEPMFLKPAFQERIWGGSKLSSLYGYDIPSDQTGEAWVISAHANGPSVITNGPLAGKTLKDAWEDHGELFHQPTDNDEAYPLLVKMLDANDDLSVQVHPNDHFARNVEGQPYGKTECWYVLQAEQGAELVLGHHATTEEELQEWMDHGEWNKLLQTVRVKAGDFFYVPSGTIHAIGEGIVILETQQSSDITYRVYDYDRVGADGTKRDLHLDRAKEVTNVPHQPVNPVVQQETFGDLTSQKMVEEAYFTVYHWALRGKSELKMEQDFLQVSVIQGDATLTTNENTFTLEKGTHFILPYGIDEYEIEGNAELIVSHTTKR